jgi:hypothetical protein
MAMSLELLQHLYDLFYAHCNLYLESFVRAYCAEKGPGAVRFDNNQDAKIPAYDSRVV